MNGAGILLLCLVFGLPLGFGLVSLLLQRAKRRHQLRLQRLQILQEALRHPQLDDGTRRQVLAVLGGEHRRTTFAQWLRVGYAAFLAAAWLTFVGGGAGWIYLEVQGRFWREVEPFVVMTIAGFALLTLPIALRELLGRGRGAPAPAGR